MRKKGFTLIELMVVILIVAILAAVAIPIMRGRIDSAKWSEGRAMMGTIATAIRAYVASDVSVMKDGVPNMDSFPINGWALLGFGPTDLDGTYFKNTDFTMASGSYDEDTQELLFVIQATKNVDSGIKTPTSITLNQDGIWTETP